MGQFNMHMTAEFEEELISLMDLMKVNSKSEAVRKAVKYLLNDLSKKNNKNFSFNSLLGIAGKRNKNSQFKTDNELWEKKS